MKTKILSVSLGLIMSVGVLFFLLPSCEQIKDATSFKVKYDLPDQHFTIDSLSHLKTEQVLFTHAYTANIDSILTANSGLLGNATFSYLQLTVVSPDWVTLNWINSARITLTPQGGDPIEVATTLAIDTVARTINFEVKNVDVASNINGPFVLNVYGDLSGPIPTGSIEMLMESGIEITINPMGGK